MISPPIQIVVLPNPSGGVREVMQEIFEQVSSKTGKTHYVTRGFLDCLNHASHNYTEPYIGRTPEIVVCDLFYLGEMAAFPQGGHPLIFPLSPPMIVLSTAGIADRYSVDPKLNIVDVLSQDAYTPQTYVNAINVIDITKKTYGSVTRENYKKTLAAVRAAVMRGRPPRP